MPADCFGPYLRYAIDTEFENFKKVIGYNENDHFRLLLLIDSSKA